MNLKKSIATTLASACLMAGSPAAAKSYDVPTKSEQAESDVRNKLLALIAPLKKACPGGSHLAIKLKKTSLLVPGANTEFELKHCDGKEGSFGLVANIASATSLIIQDNLNCIDGREVNLGHNQEALFAAITSGNCGNSDTAPTNYPSAETQACPIPLHRDRTDSFSKFVKEELLIN